MDPLQTGPLAGARGFAKAFGPPALAVGGMLPLLDARAAATAGHSVIAGAGPGAVGVLVVACVVTVVVLLRGS